MLGDLFKKYGTDKYEHNYQAFYHTMFADRRDEPLYILEIGTQEGNSTRAFLEYFPNATIVGLDSFEREGITIELDDPRVSYIKVNALAPNLYSLMQEHTKGKQFDLIIEDAVKDAALVRRTMKMILPFLKPGGIWVMEDQVLMTQQKEWSVLSVDMSNPLKAYVKDIMQRTAALMELLDYAETFGYETQIYDYRKYYENEDNSILAVIKKPKEMK